MVRPWKRLPFWEWLGYHGLYQINWYFKRIWRVIYLHKNVYIGYRREVRIERFLYDIKMAILNKKHD